MSIHAGGNGSANIPRPCSETKPFPTSAHCRHNNTFAAEIAANVSSKKRIAILEKAKVLGVKVTNADARVRAIET